MAGIDYLFGGNGNDTIYGDAGTDNLSGDAGNDIVYGGDDSDTVQGNDNDDVLDTVELLPVDPQLAGTQGEVDGEVGCGNQWHRS